MSPRGYAAPLLPPDQPWIPAPSVVRPGPVPVLPPHGVQQRPPAQVLAKLLSHFNWTFPGLVGSDSGALEQLEQQLRKEMGCAGGWGAFAKRMGSQARGTQSAASMGATSPAAAVFVGDGHH